MNEYNDLYHLLNEPDLTVNKKGEERRSLIGVLKKLADDLRLNQGEYASIAYSIAGLLATDYARNLKPNDPISEVLFLAGELEIGPPNADELLRELVQRIENL